MFKSICESDSKIAHVDIPFRNYQMFTQADMRKTFRELGFRPLYDLKSAIKETGDAERSNTL